MKEMKNPKFKVGDKISIVNSAIVGSGIVVDIVEGGENIGLPWKDNTPHYVIVDEKTKCTIIVHERNVK